MHDDTSPAAVAAGAFGRYVVYDDGGRLGVLKAVLSVPRLLLVDTPQFPGGALLIPFDAIERIAVDERTIRLSRRHDDGARMSDPLFAVSDTRITSRSGAARCSIPRLAT